MGIFSKKPQVTKDQVIKVKGLEAAMSSLKKLGANEKTARTKINKALRPAAMKAVKSLKSKYK